MSDAALIDDVTAGGAAEADATTIAAAADAGATAPNTGGDGGDADVPAYWPNDWQQRLAKEYGGEDEKAVEKELKRLQRLGDPSKIYGKMRELDARFSAGGLVKVPGKDAKPEDVAAFRKALGVPETPDGYLAGLQLSNNKVLGENDKPIAQSFAAALHEVGAPPAVVSKSVDWFLGHMEKVASDEAEADVAFKNESLEALRGEWGTSFKRNINVIGSLFSDAPEIKDLILGGRTADGRRLGDDARVIKALSKWASELNPSATVVLPGGGSMTDRLEEIKRYKTEKPDEYDQDHKVQAEERELIAARQKMQGRK